MSCGLLLFSSSSSSNYSTVGPIALAVERLAIAVVVVAVDFFSSCCGDDVKNGVQFGRWINRRELEKGIKIYPVDS